MTVSEWGQSAASIDSAGMQVSIIAYGKKPSMACKLTAGRRQWGWFVLDRAEQIWWPMSYMTIPVLDKSSSGTVTQLDIIACKSRDSLNGTGGLPQHMSTIRKTIPGASFLRDSLTIWVKKTTIRLVTARGLLASFISESYTKGKPHLICFYWRLGKSTIDNNVRVRLVIS